MSQLHGFIQAFRAAADAFAEESGVSSDPQCAILLANLSVGLNKAANTLRDQLLAGCSGEAGERYVAPPLNRINEHLK